MNTRTEQDRMHKWDDDACCKRCGFDGAEHWHWRQTMRYELGAEEFTARLKDGDYKMPPCCR